MNSFQTLMRNLQEAIMNPYGIQDRKIGYTGQKKSKIFNILWYVHPRMGLRIIDYAGGLDEKLNHAVWMIEQEGVPQRLFDRLPRGRLEVLVNQNRINEYLHKGKYTPEEVSNKLYKLYPQLKKLKLVTYKKMMDDGFDYVDEYDREKNWTSQFPEKY